MSLIVATSRIDENTLPQPSEKPSNFKNFFRSPIEIEPDSEIAVQSIKIQRTGNISIEEDDFFCHYFGVDPLLFNQYNELPCLSRTIKVPRGTYSLAGYEKILRDTLNTQYDDPRTFGGYGVAIQTSASGEELGIELQCVDKGPATANVFASLAAVPTFNIANPYYYWYESLIEKSSKFTWTPGTGAFVSTEDSTTFATSKSIGILTGFPFGLNKGEFTAELVNASTAPFIIGLTRPQIQVESFVNSSESLTTNERYSGVTYLDDKVLGQSTNETRIETYDGNGPSIEGSYECYDYCFCLDEDDNITIAQRVWNETEECSMMQELDYWNNTYPNSPGTTKLTKAQFYATWDGVQFVGVGDEVELYFKLKGKTTMDKILSSTYDSGAPGSCFSPIGTTSYALYPQINIGKGTITITNFDSSNTAGQYKYPTFTLGPTTGYTAGDDMFSNEGFFAMPRDPSKATKEKPYVKVSDAIASNALSQMIFTCDSSEQKKPIEETDGNYLFAGLNSANGVDFKHLFTMNKFIIGDRYDTLIAGQEFPNMSGRLGFTDRAFAISSNTADGYVSGDDSLTILFKSPNELQKTSLASFIRIPNLTHKSFNGAQSGLSKIVYQLPQFSNDGRQFGSLYFEANEKTYLKLNNTSPMILNMLQVQIVGHDEKELNSLTGTTQVVFHVRKHKCD